MDEIVGGSLSGTVLGALNGDVQLVGGRRSKALYTNGVDQWVDLGNQRDNCMGDLEKCNTGFVMAMWLKLHRYEEAETGIGINEYYITNGGHTRRSKGVALIRIEKKFVVNFRTPSWLWTLTTNSEIVLHTWYHVVLAWYATDGGKIYLNGIIDGEDPHGASVTSNRDGDTYTKFILGCENVAPPKLAGKMTLDELRIWDSRVNEQNVWFMYAADTQYITVVNYSWVYWYSRNKHGLYDIGLIITHWGRVTHKLTIIGSDNGLSPGRRLAINWTSTGILLIGPLGINFS